MRITALLIVLIAAPLGAQHSATRADIVYEASITDLQNLMASGKATSVDLVNAYLARIAAYDKQGPALNAVLRLNPGARADAAAMDAERKAGKVRGPLHGIPVILKDNYGTRDMPTSAGSIALAGLETHADAFQVQKLRDAGAIILGKSNMHELASGITSISSIGGQTCNPYDPDRNPGGSSGGSGASVAASFAAVAWGSDTCGSIRIPSAVHNLFGLRPTKGLSSISGIVPLSHTQDVAGPLARSVMDLAIALDATVGADPADTATRLLGGQSPPGFVASLDSTSLRGKRFGLFTEYLSTEAEDAEGARIVRAAVDKLRARGAEVIDVAIPTLDSIVGRASVINYEFKYDLIDFLGPLDNPIKSLGAALDQGLYDVQLDAGLHAREANGTRDGVEYKAALARRTVARDLVVSFLDANHLDALIYPTLRRKPATINEPQRGTTCQLSAGTGLPALTMPAGFTADGLPIGMEMLGRPLSDARLVSYAYDYERATHPRRAPPTTPALVSGVAPHAVVFDVAPHGAHASAHAHLAYDAPRRALSYEIRTTGVPASRVYAMSIVRDSGGVKGPVLRVISGPGVGAAKGTIKLTDAERRTLTSGNAAFVIYTADDPRGAFRAPLKPRS